VERHHELLRDVYHKTAGQRKTDEVTVDKRISTRKSRRTSCWQGKRGDSRRYVIEPLRCNVKGMTQLKRIVQHNKQWNQAERKLNKHSKEDSWTSRGMVKYISAKVKDVRRSFQRNAFLGNLDRTFFKSSRQAAEG
jgi:hypothetical protein